MCKPCGFYPLSLSLRVKVVVAGDSPVAEVKEATKETPQVQGARCNNAKSLREHGILALFHFTDASNLESIRKNGLLTWKKFGEMKIDAKMNSSELSQKLDSRKGLADFVRLSLCKKHPMMYIALKDKRISVPGVLFCATNAAAKASKTSASPHLVRLTS